MIYKILPLDYGALLLCPKRSLVGRNLRYTVHGNCIYNHRSVRAVVEETGYHPVNDKGNNDYNEFLIMTLNLNTQKKWIFEQIH